MTFAAFTKIYKPSLYKNENEMATLYNKSDGYDAPPAAKAALPPEDFQPAMFFSGPRKGFVFMRGSAGLGYYRERNVNK